MNQIRVLLVDDHAIVLEGLKALVGAEADMVVAGAAMHATEAYDAIRRDRPDVVVLDLEMSPPGGIACIEHIRREALPVRVLVLTGFSDVSSMRATLEAGADGYALKTEPPRQTLDAIRQVARGQLVFPRAARRWLVAKAGAGDPEALTAREGDVLALVAEGASNAEIARRLRVSGNTVKFHLQHIYGKLGVTNRTEAAAHYLRERRAR